MAKNPLAMLVILDGWGWREEPADNAVRQAAHATFDGLWAAWPHAFLRTSGNDVGLPPKGRWATPRSATSTSAPGGSSCRTCRGSTRRSPTAAREAAGAASA